MHFYLQARETGQISPSHLKSLENTRQLFHLQKSNALPHSNGIMWLDLDRQEGRYLLSAGMDGSIKGFDLFNVEEHQDSTLFKIEKPVSHTFSVTGIQWYPHDTGLFTTSSFDHTLKIWDTNTLQAACNFTLENRIYMHQMSQVSTSHSLIAAGTKNGRIRLCDLQTGASVHTLQSHSGTVLSLQWSPIDHFLLCSGSQDNTVRVWDIRQAIKPLYSLEHNGPVNGLSFMDLGYTLISTSLDRQMRLWDVITGQKESIDFSFIKNRNLQPLQLAVADSNYQHTLLFHPTDEGTVHCYHLRTGKLMFCLTGHIGRIYNCLLNDISGEPMLLTAGVDEEVLIWRPGSGNENDGDPGDFWSDHEE